ncbi:hypothetical protein [Rubrimonas cliftonensis]|nr:hypothetical protein [Rubrimonas cliftonensis]
MDASLDFFGLRLKQFLIFPRENHQLFHGLSANLPPSSRPFTDSRKTVRSARSASAEGLPMTAIITVTDDEIIIAPLGDDEDLPELDGLEPPEIDGDEDFGPVTLLIDHDEDEQDAVLRLAVSDIAWARRSLRSAALTA